MKRNLWYIKKFLILALFITAIIFLVASLPSLLQYIKLGDTIHETDAKVVAIQSKSQDTASNTYKVEAVIEYIDVQGMTHTPSVEFTDIHAIDVGNTYTIRYLGSSPEAFQLITDHSTNFHKPILLYVGLKTIVVVGVGIYWKYWNKHKKKPAKKRVVKGGV